MTQRRFPMRTRHGQPASDDVADRQPEWIVEVYQMFGLEPEAGLDQLALQVAQARERLGEFERRLEAYRRGKTCGAGT
jgi:hypothetical protein